MGMLAERLALAAAVRLLASSARREALGAARDLAKQRGCGLPTTDLHRSLRQIASLQRATERIW